MNEQAIQTEQVKLEKFNRMVQQYQDESYTLAFYLLGNQAEAIESLEAAVQKAYRGRRDARGPFRLWFFRYVVVECQRKMKPGNQEMALSITNGTAEFQAMISRLPERMRIITILVDLLGLRYQEAAVVCDLPVVMVRRMTAEARAYLS